MRVFLFIVGGVLIAAGGIWVTLYCVKLPRLLTRYADGHPERQNGDGLVPVREIGQSVRDAMTGVFKKTWYHIVIPLVLLSGGLYVLSAAWYRMK